MRHKDRWTKRIDGVLSYVVAIFVGIMLLAQLLLLKEGTRLYLSKVDKLEGEDLTATMHLYADTPLPMTEETTVVKNYQNLLRSRKVIVIKMMNNPQNANVFVMVNGTKIDNFGAGDCKLTVYDGDYVEIDGTSLSEAVTFLIEVPDEGLLSPQDGLRIKGVKGIFPVGKIKFKNE